MPAETAGSTGIGRETAAPMNAGGRPRSRAGALRTPRSCAAAAARER